MENFVIHVIRKLKYAVDARYGRVYLNLKKIRKVSLVKYPEGGNAENAANGKSRYL